MAALIILINPIKVKVICMEQTILTFFLFSSEFSGARAITPERAKLRMVPEEEMKGCAVGDGASFGMTHSLMMPLMKESCHQDEVNPTEDVTRPAHSALSPAHPINTSSVGTMGALLCSYADVTLPLGELASALLPCQSCCGDGHARQA